MTHNDMITRVEMMACDGEKWELSPNDTDALRYVLRWTKDLQMVCDNRGRREEELRAVLADVASSLESIVADEVADGRRNSSAAQIARPNAKRIRELLGQAPSESNSLGKETPK